MHFEINEFLEHLIGEGKNSVNKMNSDDIDYFVYLLIKNTDYNFLPSLEGYDEKRIIMTILNTYIRNRTNDNAHQLAGKLKDIAVKVFMPEIEALVNEKNMEKERSEFYKTRYKYGVDESSEGHEGSL